MPVKHEATAPASMAATSPALQQRIARLASESGRSTDSVATEVAGYLHELRTRHDPLVHGLSVKAGRALCGLGYSRIDYDLAQVERMREVFARHPTVVLSSHRSYLDGGALTVGFSDHGLPAMAEFVGINMGFWPLGPIWRRMGGIFIRRGSAGPVYKLALREYLGRLVEQRRPMRWFIEGTRSRTGKLAPPKLGLLVYVVDAYLQGRVDDLMLVPVSVSYDQLHEVKEFAGEARGTAKEAESLGWLVRYIRSQRGRFGTIYVRFGEPVSVRQALGPPASGASDAEEERSLALNKLAFEVSWRINHATPITGAALVAVALLAARGVPLAPPQFRVALSGYLGQARDRGFPLAPSAEVDDMATLGNALRAFEARGVVTSARSGNESRYRVAPEGHLAIAYYRNSIIHFFLLDAIAELALLKASRAPGEAREQRFWEEAFEIRDLLKFEFFFQEKDRFRAAMAGELMRLAPQWRERLGQGAPGVRAILEQAQTLCSDMMLRAFVEAYLIVADTLVDWRKDRPFDETAFIDLCESRGEDYLRTRKIRNPESVSRHLFRTGLKVAANRGLLEPDDMVGMGRRALARQLRSLARRMALVRAIAVRRVLAGVGDASR